MSRIDHLNEYKEGEEERSRRRQSSPATPSSLIPTIFHEPWWMEIASEGSWSEALVSSGGLPVGRLPYQISKMPLGMKALGMPTLAHVLGPAVAPQLAGENFPRSLKELSIVGDLLAQLPKASHISFRLHSGITNTLAFDINGFICKPEFTVMVEPDTRESLWLQMRDKTRNVIRRAEESLHVESLPDSEVFLDFYQENLHRSGRKNTYRRRTCSRLIAECLQRAVGRILIARDKSGKIQAAVFTVWDKSTEFYFMSTRRPDSLNGAICLLMWEALQHASKNGLHFDMDGIHVAKDGLPNLLLLTGFGGAIKTRYLVYRTSPALQFAYGLRKFSSSAWQRLFGKGPHDAL